MSEQIGTGSAEGLYEFCDWLVKKGLMTTTAVEPLRSATKQIITTVDSEDPSSVNVGDASFDVNSYMDRFITVAGSKYAPDSLNAYKRRFTRAVELYRQYLEQGAANFKAPAVRVTRKRPTKENGGNGSGHAASTPPPAAPAAPPAPAGMIQYPFPLASGEVAQLTLPPRLEKEDAERMMRFVQALVFEPQRQIAAASEPTA
jgi:hypothetical protein